MALPQSLESGSLLTRLGSEEGMAFARHCCFGSQRLSVRHRSRPGGSKASAITNPPPMTLVVMPSPDPWRAAGNLVVNRLDELHAQISQRRAQTCRWVRGLGDGTANRKAAGGSTKHLANLVELKTNETDISKTPGRRTATPR